MAGQCVYDSVSSTLKHTTCIHVAFKSSFWRYKIYQHTKAYINILRVCVHLMCIVQLDSLFVWLILYFSVSHFQLCRDGSSWVEPVLSKDNCVLLKDKTQWRRTRGPSVLIQALYHWATVLPVTGFETISHSNIMAKFIFTTKIPEKYMYKCFMVHANVKFSS